MIAEASTSHVVRVARHDDVLALSVIWRELMDYHARSDDRFALAPDADDRWRELGHELIDRTDAFLFAADLNGRLVGFCLGWIAKNPTIYRLPELGFLSEISVASACRRRGIGRDLMQEARQWFIDRGLEEFQLSTAVWNTTAQAFWQSLGGEPLLLRYHFPLPNGPSADSR